MKQFIMSMLVVVSLATVAMAHTLFMVLCDNEDGTITVEGMYSTGAAASSTEVRLEDPEGKVLFQGKTDMDGELEIKKPSGPYVVIMDGGPGHVVQEEGL